MIRTLAALILTAAPALAEELSPCGPSPVGQTIIEAFDEARLGAGTSDDTGDTFEVWVNPDTGTWTIFATDGKTGCFIASGEGWAFGAETVKGDPL